MGYRITRAVATALLFASWSVSHADYIVDTGLQLPTAGGVALAGFQSVGATFAVSEATSITGVETFLRTLVAGSLDVALYSGAPGVSSLYRRGFDLSPSPSEDWTVFGGLDWSVNAGNYTVTFEPVADGSLHGFLSTNPSSPLEEYWWRADVDWLPLDSELYFALRVAATPGLAIPEPDSYLLLLAGLGLLLAVRRRSS